jgi:hypothetical protein
MTGQRFERIMCTATLLITLITAIPQVYNFEKKRFFWQTDLPDGQIKPPRNIQPKSNVIL